ncbi:ChbG/HpnK family deacetylase [Variovorax sp. UC74_104]|uniref:ChbG/HpnK family deacetylase n=1 Tax=Variovorax sp. UC74_104 TaxID=3374555 RepID=UPI0037576B8C
MSEPLRYLCICADDFGMSAGINSAVLDLAEQGRISATSAMVRREVWLAGARMLRRLDPARFDAGLHLDLTRPAHAGGAEPGLGGLIARTYTRTVFAPGVQADIRDQLTRFEDAMGRAPAFVDGHRHVHQFPVVRELLVEEIARRYAGSPPWIRSTAPGLRQGPDRLKARIIHSLGGSRLNALAAKRGIPTSSRLLGVYDFSGDIEQHERRLSDWLSACRTGDVLMCHPSAGIAPGDPHGGARLREYTALLGLRLEAAGGSERIELAPLSQTLRQA